MSEIQYVTLIEGSDTVLLARVRWPDVADAITPGLSEWQTDPGLFDLPYDPNGASVTRERAETIAAKWGTYLPSATSSVGSGPSVIRRMPANWSQLSSAERRAWGLEPYAAGRRRRRAPRAHAHRRRGRLERLRSSLGRAAPAQDTKAEQRVLGEPAERDGEFLPAIDSLDGLLPGEPGERKSTDRAAPAVVPCADDDSPPIEETGASPTAGIASRLLDPRFAGIEMPIDDTTGATRSERTSGDPRPGVR